LSFSTVTQGAGLSQVILTCLSIYKYSMKNEKWCTILRSISHSLPVTARINHIWWFQFCPFNLFPSWI